MTVAVHLPHKSGSFTQRFFNDWVLCPLPRVQERAGAIETKLVLVLDSGGGCEEDQTRSTNDKQSI